MYVYISLLIIKITYKSLVHLQFQTCLSFLISSVKIMKCREKELPHYFGRLIHALDLIKFSQNEGTLKNLQQQQVYYLSMKLENY